MLRSAPNQDFELIALGSPGSKLQSKLLLNRLVSSSQSQNMIWVLEQCLRVEYSGWGMESIA